MRLTVWALVVSSGAWAQTAGVTLSPTDTPASLNFGGPSIPIVQALAVDPVNHGVLYAIANNGYDGSAYDFGVFRSRDSGASWSLWSTFKNIDNVYALAIDPITPTTIYAEADPGVFKSIDGGTTWSPLNTSLVRSLAIDPANPSTLYTAGNLGVLKSTDGGTSWSSANAGLPRTLVSITVDPVNTSTVYCIPFESGVFKSTDGAVNWTASDTGLPNVSSVNALVINPKNTATLYTATFGNGIFKSADGGANWSPVNTGLADLHVGNLDTSVGGLAIDPGNPDTLYASTGAGVFKTINGGLSWAPANTGLPPPSSDPSWSAAISGLAVDPTDSATVYLASALGGVYKSTDGAARWDAASNGLSSHPAVPALAINPSDPANIYAWTFASPPFYFDPVVPQQFASGGVFQSPDGGESWSGGSFGPGGGQALAIDPSNPSTLYAAPFLSMVMTPAGGGVMKSTDGGATWEPANSGFPTFTVYENGQMYSTTPAVSVGAFAIDPTNPATVYAAVTCGAYKTSDGGANWSSAGAASSCSASLVFSSMAVDPANPTTIYAGTINTGTLFRSVDGGGSWSTFGSTLPVAGIPALAVALGSPSAVYAGTREDGIFTSVDGGASWTAASSGLPNVPILALAVDPSVPQTIYAGTSGNGVFKSTDAGVTWQATGTKTENRSTPCNFRGVRRQPDGAGRTIIAFPTGPCRD